MSDLQEFVRVVNRYKTRKLELIGNVATVGGKESTYQEFYKLLCAGGFKNELEAAQYFGYESEKEKGYRRLKTGLKKRLINASILMDSDQPHYSEHRKIYFKCSKIWITINTLYLNNSIDLAIELAESLVKELEKIGATDLLYFVLEFLRHRSAFYLGDGKKFEHYNELAKKCSDQLQKEQVVRTYYCKMTIQLFKKKKFTQAFAGELKSYVADLDKIKSEDVTNLFLLYYYTIAIASETTARNFESAMIIADNAIEAYGKRVYHSQNNLASFYHQKVYCLISLNRLAEAEEEVQKCNDLLIKGSFNWFKDRELLITIFIHQSKFKEAWKTYEEAIETKGFSQLNKINIQHWKLIDAWLNFLLRHYKIDLEGAVTLEKNFRINKFLNEVPIYSKDKSGMNVQLIILQILFALQSKKYALITDKVDALKKYQSRYLRKDDNYRSNLMIRMLIAMTNASFHKTVTLRKTVELCEQMQNVPVNLIDTNIFTEKVSYEMIWNCALEYLDEKMH